MSSRNRPFSLDALSEQKRICFSHRKSKIIVSTPSFTKNHSCSFIYVACTVSCTYWSVNPNRTSCLCRRYLECNFHHYVLSFTKGEVGRKHWTVLIVLWFKLALHAFPVTSKSRFFECFFITFINRKHNIRNDIVYRWLDNRKFVTPYFPTNNRWSNLVGKRIKDLWFP